MTPLFPSAARTETKTGRTKTETDATAAATAVATAIAASEPTIPQGSSNLSLPQPPRLL